MAQLLIRQVTPDEGETYEVLFVAMERRGGDVIGFAFNGADSWKRTRCADSELRALGPDEAKLQLAKNVSEQVSAAQGDVDVDVPDSFQPTETPSNED